MDNVMAVDVLQSIQQLMEVVLAGPFLKGTIGLDEITNVTTGKMLLNED